VLAAAIVIMPALHAETRASQPASASHPMDGVTAREIVAAVDLLHSADLLHRPDHGAGFACRLPRQGRDDGPLFERAIACVASGGH
jgi:hypothetical protein